MRRFSSLFLLFVALVAACADDPVVQVPDPAPILAGLSPSSAIVGDVARVVVLTGERFTMDSRVIWNGEERPARFISAQRLEVTLDTADLNRSHTAVVRVANGFTYSADRQFRVQGIIVKLRGPDRIVLAFGETYQLGSSVVSEAGTELPIAVEWTSSNAQVAWVDETGKIEAIHDGSARITVSARGDSAAMQVLVTSISTPGAFRCEGAGTEHTADITSSETWTRAGNPHWISRSISLRSQHPQPGPATVLTLEPGVQVCARSDAYWIKRGAHTVIRSIGTSDLPIELGISIVDEGLNPVFASDTTHLVHTRVSGSITALSTHLVIENSQLLENVLHGWAPGTSATLRRSTFYGDVDLGGAARVENVLVRTGSIYLRSGSRTRLIDVRIEGARQAGLTMENFGASLNPAPQLLEARGVRVRASGTYPAILSAQGAAVLLKDQAAQDSLRKNVLDTLIVYGTATEPLVVRSGVPWRVVQDERNPALGRALAAPAIRFEPGAVFDGGFAGGVVVAAGTAEQPVTLLEGPINISGAESALSYFRMRDAVVDALRVTTPVTLSNCKITHSGRDGVVVLQPVRLTVRSCDFEDNGSAAIRDFFSAPAEAFDVWLRNNAVVGVTLINPRTSPNWPHW